jgi:hypothetical protein
VRQPQNADYAGVSMTSDVVVVMVLLFGHVDV